MNRLNKKGFTLVELLISIILVSVVIGFISKLILEINNQKNNDDYARKNQFNRAEMIQKIENDFINLKLVKIEGIQETTENIKLNFYFSDNTTKSLEVYEDYIRYDNQKWSIENAKYDNQKLNVYYNEDDNYFTLIINVLVYTDNSRNDTVNNNNLDDINLTYVGKTSTWKGSKLLECIGYKC